MNRYSLGCLLQPTCFDLFVVITNVGIDDGVVDYGIIFFVRERRCWGINFIRVHRFLRCLVSAHSLSVVVNRRVFDRNDVRMFSHVTAIPERTAPSFIAFELLTKRRGWMT